MQTKQNNKDYIVGIKINPTSRKNYIKTKNVLPSLIN